MAVIYGYSDSTYNVLNTIQSLPNFRFAKVVPLLISHKIAFIF